jgi:C-terminal processing protease CtpA/Prc
VCVLTAARTSSAAEALAFHLQQLGRARVVGERSAGAAHPSRRLPLSDRFAIMLPTSRAFDPETGRDWEGTGVQPDLETPAEDALCAAHVELLERLAQGPCDPERSRELRDIAASVKAAH